MGVRSIRVTALLVALCTVIGGCCCRRCPPREGGPKQSKYEELEAKTQTGSGGVILFRGFTVINADPIDIVNSEAMFFNDWSGFLYPMATTGDDHALVNGCVAMTPWVPVGPVPPGGTSPEVGPGVDIRATRVCLKVDWADATTQYYTVSLPRACNELKFLVKLKVEVMRSAPPVINTLPGGNVTGAYRDETVPKTMIPPFDDNDYLMALPPFIFIGYQSMTPCDDPAGGPPATKTNCP